MLGRMIIYRVLHNQNFRNGTLFAFFSFFNTGVNFVIMLVLARFIMPDSYGQLSLYTTMVTLLSIFVCLNTNGFIGVNFFISPKEKMHRLLNVVLLTSLLVYMVFLTLTFCFSTKFEEVSGLTLLYQFYALSFCLLNVMNVLLLDIWRLEEKVWSYGTFSFLQVLGNLILTILFVGILKWDWQGRMYAQVITCTFFAIVALYLLVKKDYLHCIFPRKEDFVGAYKFGVPLLPHSTSFWLRQGLDRYVINAFATQSVVGLFSFAANFASIIQIVGSAFNASNSVYIYKTLSDLDDVKMKTLRRNCQLLVFFYSALTLVVFIGAALFIPLVFPKYETSVKLVFPLCVGAMFQCFYLVYVNILFFYKKTKELMYITFSLSLLHVILSFLLTRYGVMYTACVSILSSVLISFFVYKYSLLVLKKNYINSCHERFDYNQSGSIDSTNSA